MSGRAGSHVIWRFAVVVVGLLICSWLMWNAARVGAARLLSKHGSGATLIEPADQAVEIGTEDPESYSARASVLLNLGQAAAAAGDFEKAISLRPNDYRLWMQLGDARDQAGNTAGALSAFGEATGLAPFYAQTHWQRGNLLLRSGSYEEAFAELRRAATSQPSLASQVIDLTWGIYKGDARAVELVVAPRTSAARMALAIYFAQRGKATDAIRLFRESRRSSEQEKRALLTALLAAKQFPESYEVWASSHQANAGGERPQLATIIDGGFESEIGLDDPGFGWQITPDMQAIRFSLDSGSASAGTRSLQINWNGNPPSSAIISQLVLAEPRKHYELSFDVQTRNLVTAGSPTVAVKDAKAQTRLLAQSTPLPQGTNNWQKVSLSFDTAETTQAVLNTVERPACTMGICPIFGQTWFDNFALR